MLRSLAAIEEEDRPVERHRHRGDIALTRRRAGRGAEEDDAEVLHWLRGYEVAGFRGKPPRNPVTSQPRNHHDTTTRRDRDCSTSASPVDSSSCGWAK